MHASGLCLVGVATQFIQYMVYICEINLLFGSKYSPGKSGGEFSRCRVKNKYNKKDIEYVYLGSEMLRRISLNKSLGNIRKVLYL